MIRIGALRETIDLYEEQTAGSDRYGDVTYTEGLIGTYPAAVAPAGESEEEVRRDTFTSLYHFTVGPDCPVTGTSSVVWRGTTYEVVGEPEDHVHKRELHHIEFLGRVVE